MNNFLRQSPEVRRREAYAREVRKAVEVVKYQLVDFHRERTEGVTGVPGTGDNGGRALGCACGVEAAAAALGLGWGGGSRERQAVEVLAEVMWSGQRGGLQVRAAWYQRAFLRACLHSKAPAWLAELEY